MNFLNPLFSSTGSYGRSSILTPLNWFTGVSLSAVVYTIVKAQAAWVQVVMVVVAVTIVLAYLAIYVVLLIKKPNFILSEHYHLEKMRMNLIAQKGSVEPIEVLDTLPGIADPAPVLPEGLGENDAAH
jgi:hypothetical protein